MDCMTGQYPTRNKTNIGFIYRCDPSWQPGTKPHDLSEHISGAASQTPCAEPTPSLPAQAEPYTPAAEQSPSSPRAREEGTVSVNTVMSTFYTPSQDNQSLLLYYNT